MPARKKGTDAPGKRLLTKAEAEELAWYQERLDVCARNFDAIVIVTRMCVSSSLQDKSEKATAQAIALLVMETANEFLNLNPDDRTKFWSNIPAIQFAAEVVKEVICQLPPDTDGDGGDDGEPFLRVA